MAHFIFLVAFGALLCTFASGEIDSKQRPRYLDHKQLSSLLKQREEIARKGVHIENSYHPRHVRSLGEAQALKQWREFSSAYNPDTMHLLELLTTAVKGKENLVRETMRPVFKRIENGEKMLDEIISEFVEANSNGRQVEEERAICRVCNVLVLALKAASATGLTWDDLYLPLYALCVNAGPLIVPHLRADVLCAGTLNLQGPYAFDALSGVTPPARKHCEFLNACFPNATATSVVETKSPAKQISRMRENDALHIHDRTPRAKRDLSNALKVIQMTDIHIEENYKEDSLVDCKLPVCCLEKWGPGDAGPYGEYMCNTPPRTLDLFVDKVAQLNPDFIVYSGDNPPHTVWEETAWSQWNCTRFIIDAFNKKLSAYRIYPNIGNHELYPTNIYFQNLNYTQDAAKHFTEWWKVFANFSADNIATMEKGSYYSLVAYPGLRILSYNTNFMYTYNWYNPVQDNIRQNNVLRQMETFFEDTLKNAQTSGEKVLIVGHHPPAKSDFIVKFSRWLTNLHLQYSDVIALHMTGHSHKDEFRLFKDGLGKAQQMVYVAPSVTNQNYKNPAMRMYYLDKTTFEVLDYENYFLDLQKVVDVNPVPEIDLLYRASEEYGLTDLSPASWENLVDRMKTDDALFMKYHQNHYSHAPPGEYCDPVVCKTEHLCMLSNSNYDEYRMCTFINTPSTTTTTTTSTTTSPTTTTTTAPTTTTTVLMSCDSPPLYGSVTVLFLIVCSALWG